MEIRLNMNNIIKSNTQNESHPHQNVLHIKKEFLGGVKTKMIMKVISNYYKEIKKEELKLEKTIPTKLKIWGIVNKLRDIRKLNKISLPLALGKPKVPAKPRRCIDRCIMHPDTNIFRIFLDSIFNVLIFIDLLIMPFEYCLLDMYEKTYTREIIFDSIFLFEIFTNFFTGFKSKGRYIKDYKLIALNYLKFRFFFDVSYVFPFWVFGSKLIYFRLIKLYRYPSLLQKIRKIIFFINSLCMKSLKILHGMTAILIILIHLIFLIHYSGILYVYIGSLENPERNWINKAGISSYSVWERYLVAVYFMIETFISIGYGDFTPANTMEILYIMSTQILFVGLLAYLMSCIIEVFKNLSIKELTISTKLKQEIDLDAYLANYNNQISQVKKKELNKKTKDGHFFKKIEYYFMWYYKLDHGWIKDFKFLDWMRPTERNLIIDQIFSNLFEFFNNFFVEFEKIPNFKRNIAMSLEAFFLEKNTVLLNESSEKEMEYFYFICNGIMNVAKNDIEICDYLPGSFFGDEFLISKNQFFTYKSLDGKGVFLFRLPIKVIVDLCSYDENVYLIMLKKSMIRMKNLNKEYNKSKIENKKRARLYLTKTKSNILKEEYETKNKLKNKNKNNFENGEQVHPHAESVPNPNLKNIKCAFTEFDNEDCESINSDNESYLSEDNSIHENFCEFDFSDLNNLNKLDLNVEKFGDFPKILKKLEKSKNMIRNADLIEKKIEYLNKKLEDMRNNFYNYVKNVRKINMSVKEM